MCACVHACVRTYVRACVRVCMLHVMYWYIDFSSGSGDVEILYNDFFQYHSKERSPYSSLAVGTEGLCCNMLPCSANICIVKTSTVYRS